MRFHDYLVLLCCGAAVAHPSPAKAADDADRAFERDLQKSDAVLKDFDPLESRIKGEERFAAKMDAQLKKSRRSAFRGAKRQHRRGRAPRGSFLQKKAGYDFGDDDSEDSPISDPVSDSDGGDVDAPMPGSDIDSGSDFEDPGDSSDHDFGEDASDDSFQSPSIADGIAAESPNIFSSPSIESSSLTGDAGDFAPSAGTDDFAGSLSGDAGADAFAESGGDSFSLLQTHGRSTTGRSAGRASRIAPEDKLKMARDLEALRRDAIEEVALPQISERTSVSPAATHS